MGRVLVLDGHSAAALAFTRSLGRAGHWVALGANQGVFAPAILSRYCKLSFKYPVSTDDTAVFAASVAQLATKIDQIMLSSAEHAAKARFAPISITGGVLADEAVALFVK